LVKKEIKAGKSKVDETLSDHKKQKIKDFVKIYMGKVMARKLQKETAKLQKQQEQQQENASVSTGTPQLPGSTPRDISSAKEIENDVIGENEDGGKGSLSPTEFLKTLERDGLLER
jgi:hypothetical protein